ncbi:MAG: prolyl oligopeptidase family serine peptidase [Candidatus Thorarchaeota archaeon]
MSNEKLLFTPEDFIHLKSVKNPKISPDGNSFAFVIQKVSSDSNTYNNNIFIGYFDSNEKPRQFTTGGKDNLPKWSPNGDFLAFLSARHDNGKKIEEKTGPQLYIIPKSGGESIKITNFPNGVKDFEWHPTKLAFIVLTWVSEKEFKDLVTNDEKKERPNFITDPILALKYDMDKKTEKDLENDPQHIVRSYYRQLNFYNDKRVDQLFIINLDNDLYNYKFDPIPLTNLEYFYTQGFWSIDGKTIYTTRPVGGDPYATRLTEIVSIDISSKEIHILIEMEGVDPKIIALPDKKHIIFTAAGEKGGDVYRNHQVYLMKLNDSKALKNISSELDCHFTSINLYDNSHLFGIVPEKGEQSIYQLEVLKDNKNIIKILNGSKFINEFDCFNGKILFVNSNENNPSELYSFDLNQQIEQKHTSINSDFVDSHLIAKVEKNITKNSNQEITSWLLLPPNHDGKSVLPVILEIHGGPSTMWSSHENTMWLEFNLLVSAGYAVVFTNPRGSDGYGYEFRKAVYKNWGELPASDIMTGLDFYLNKYSFLDSNRVGVTGGSYGGYMTAWLLGHFPERFKAGVAQRGVYDFQSLALSTDIVSWFEGQYGSLWDNLDQYWKDSPISAVQNFQAPLLIIHSNNDFRVPVTTSEQLFWACKRFNKIVEFVKYPREGHELSRSGEPRHRIDRLNKIVNWFKRYL